MMIKTTLECGCKTEDNTGRTYTTEYCTDHRPRYKAGKTSITIEELEVVKMERPLTLTYTDGIIFGTKASKAAVEGCFDQGWFLYRDLMESGWEAGDANRAALHTIIANLVATVNMDAERAAQ